jgi:hypothetical protein
MKTAQIMGHKYLYPQRVWVIRVREEENIMSSVITIMEIVQFRVMGLSQAFKGEVSTT